MGKPADVFLQRKYEYAAHNIVPAQTSPGHVILLRRSRQHYIHTYII